MKDAISAHCRTPIPTIQNALAVSLGRVPNVTKRLQRRSDQNAGTLHSTAADFGIRRVLSMFRAVMRGANLRTRGRRRERTEGHVVYLLI
eukprot:8066659-Pyramimonas_sp.AAC.1